jgi:DegV family protein with EDD domain
VETLEFLHRGGRIGGASRLLGTALNLKPLLEVRDGRVEALERIRTKAKARERLIEVITDRLADQETVRIAALHGAAEGEASDLLNAAKRNLNPIEAFMGEITPVIGTHAGPGVVGIAYCHSL